MLKDLLFSLSLQNKNDHVFLINLRFGILFSLQCEKLRLEVALLPSIKAELEALRVRHSAALELMGERDEEVHYLQV